MCFYIFFMLALCITCRNLIRIALLRLLPSLSPLYFAPFWRVVLAIWCCDLSVPVAQRSFLPRCAVYYSTFQSCSRMVNSFNKSSILFVVYYFSLCFLIILANYFVCDVFSTIPPSDMLSRNSKKGLSFRILVILESC